MSEGICISHNVILSYNKLTSGKKSVKLSFERGRSIHKVFLTFDVEDFINDRSVLSLNRILILLSKYDFKALFFITGHMAEMLSNFPKTLDLLTSHEIGYHSSSHSVRPAIFEYTDVPSYKEAYLKSLKRETSHINPLTGEVEGKGGIEVLKELFPKKNIVFFRAPGLCWIPPHFDALVKLGIKFDFSACVSSEPVYYKNATFYPYQIQRFIDDFDLRTYRSIFFSLLKNRVTVLILHPSTLVNQDSWDAIYYEDNPKKLLKIKSKTQERIKSTFLKFELILKFLKLLEKNNLIEVTSEVKESRKYLVASKWVIRKCYQGSMGWASEYFDYKPQFLFSHFLHYFDASRT